jgi:O-antigen/teichoic acid export membrane protein
MDNHYNRLHLFRSGGWALFGTIFSTVLGLTINVLLTRLVSASDVGVYFLLVSFVAFCAILAQAGVLQVLLRRVSLSPLVGKRRGAADDIKSACMYIGMGVCLVGSLILLFFNLWVEKFAPGRPELNSIVFLIIVWMATLAYRGVVAESFRGFHNIRDAVLFGGLFSNALLVIALGAFYIGGFELSLNDLVMWVVGLTMLTLVIGLSLLSSQVTTIKPGAYMHRLKALYHDAMPLLLSGLLMVVISQGDLWIVGLYRGNKDTAIYGVAAKLAVLTGMPLNLLNAILPPHISQLHAANRLAELEKLLRVSAGIACIPAILMALGAVFLGSDVLGFLYGNQFRQAGPILAVLCVGQLCHVMLGSSGLVLMLTGMGRALMATTLISCLFLIVGGAIAASHGLIWIGTVEAGTLVIQKMLMCKVVNSRVGIHTHARLDRDFFRIIHRSSRR